MIAPTMQSRLSSRRPKRTFRLAVFAATSFALVSATACDKVPLTAPSESTITLTASATVLPVQGTTVLTAVVLEKPGTPVQNGTVVTFSATLGTVEPQEARTKDSKVTVTFRAGTQSGEASINASSGSAKLSEALTIKIGAAAAQRISLSASPTSVPLTGGTSQLVAMVFDEGGNPLPGVPVSFVASAGTLADTSVVTGSGGDARTTLRTSRETTVTAAAGTQTAEVKITATPGPSASISVTTTNPLVGQTTQFQVGASVATGGSPIQDVTVEFGDGQHASLGALSTTASITHIYRSAGSYTASVTAVDTAGFSTSVSTIVTVNVAPPLAVTISGNLTPVSGIASTYIATVTVGGGASLPAIQRYEWDFGDYSAVVVTTGNQTSHSFLSGGVKVIRVTVYAVDGSTGVGSMEVTVSSTAVTPLSVAVTPSTSTPTVGIPVAFSASVSGTSGGIIRYEWDFGDGTSVQVTTGNQTSHNFTAAGTRTVRVTVVGLNGATGVGQTEVVVRAGD